MLLHTKEYLTFNESERDIQWAGRLVTFFRQQWRPLVDPLTAGLNRSLVLSRNDLVSVGELEKMFKDPKKIGMTFLPIAIFERIRNILIGEAENAGIAVRIDAVDPTSDIQRKNDRKLLENRAEIESLMTFLQKSIGLPEYSMKNDRESGLNGSLDGFDEMGLDPTNNEDIGYYMKFWHKLLHEMDAQAMVDHVFAVNEVSQYIPEWINDLLSTKSVALQTYVDEMTGMQVIKRLSPELMLYIPGGRRKDGADDLCKGYEEKVSIGELLRRFGNDFDIEENITWLITAVNYSRGSASAITGVYDGVADKVYGTGAVNTESVCVWQDFMLCTVTIGYIEWKVWDAAHYKAGIDFHGNFRAYRKNSYYQPTEDTGYKAESRYHQVTYKSYYISLSQQTQTLFKFGKLYHQAIEGAEDEYSAYSIKTYVKEGPPAAEVAKPWITLAQETFLKFRWMVRKSKPKGRSYNYQSLVQLANKMIKEGDPATKVASVIKMFEEGINEIYMTPQLNGERVGGGSNPNFDLPNGLDATAIYFKDIIDWAVVKIMEDMSINQVRTGYNPKANEGLGLQEQTTAASMNATAYLGRSIDWIIRGAAKHVLLTCQDVVRYKDTLPFNYILRLFGEERIERLKSLDQVGLHRYDIMISSMGSYVNRQKVLQDTDFAFQNKLITYDVKLLIDNINDPNRAAYILAFEKKRADRIAREAAEAQQQHELQIATIAQQTQIGQVDTKGKWDVERENVRGKWLYETKKLELEAETNLKREVMDREAEKQQARADGQKQILATKQQLENQRPLL